MGKRKQSQRVYYSSTALCDALKRFGFHCKDITPTKAFSACGGSWLTSLEFIDTNFTHILDRTVKISKCEPTMLLKNREGVILRLCSCHGGGCSGYRLLTMDDDIIKLPFGPILNALKGDCITESQHRETINKYKRMLQ